MSMWGSFPHIYQFEIFEILHIYVSVKSKVQHPPPPPGTPSGHPFRAFEFFLEICVQIPDSLGQKAVHMPHFKPILSDILPCKLCLNSEISLVIPSFFSFELPYPDLKMPFWYHFFFQDYQFKTLHEVKIPTNICTWSKGYNQMLSQISFPSGRQRHQMPGVCPGMGMLKLRFDWYISKLVCLWIFSTPTLVHCWSDNHLIY